MWDRAPGMIFGGMFDDLVPHLILWLAGYCLSLSILRLLPAKSRTLDTAPLRNNSIARSSWKKVALAMSVMLLACVLVFFGLTHRPLWQDEAETACLGRNVVRFGAPVVYDGLNIVSQEQRADCGDDLIWRWSPWLQIYVSAASQKLLGSNTFSARAPFAVFGLASIALTFLVVYRRFRDFRWALLSAFLLAVSVPFLLYIRQGRYYGLGAALTVMCLACLLSDWRRKRYILAFSFCMGLMFHLNYLLFGSLAVALATGAWLYYPDRIQWKSVLWTSCIVGIVVAPGFFLYKIGAQGGMIRVDAVYNSILQYANEILLFMLPLPVLGYVAWESFRRYCSSQRHMDEQDRFVAFCTVVIAVSVLVLSIAPQQFFRYIVHLFPLAAIVSAWACLKLLNVNLVTGWTLIGVLSLTNWLHVVSLEYAWRIYAPYNNTYLQLSWPNIPLQLYIAEAICEADDVNESLVKFFNAHAKPGDVIFSEYNDLTLQFYTPFRVVGGLQGKVENDAKPDWVWMRRQIMLNRNGDLFLGTRYILEELSLKSSYVSLPIPGSNETYENTGDVLIYCFLPFPGASELAVYRKVQQ